ncbi:MAG: SH3 domain-containing protein, partial [Flavobacteriaceae bacterium]
MNSSHGICALSVINVYREPSETSVIVNQLLYGDHFEVLQRQKFWSEIRLDYDQTEGFILNNAYVVLDKHSAEALTN